MLDADKACHVFQAELDRFCNTLIAIREEIAEIEDGKVDRCISELQADF